MNHKHIGYEYTYDMTYFLIKKTNAIDIKLHGNIPLKLHFVCTKYNSMHQLFTKFDLDCSECAFTGKAILCSPRFIQSINTRTMFFSFTKDLHIYRIAYYYLQGFDILLPPTYVIFYKIY